MRIKIVIEGDVIPAARPRFSGRRCYQPARNVEYREQVQWTARQSMKGRAPFAGAMSAIVKLYRKYRPTARIYGDVDNHLKALFDGMNQIVFVDDSLDSRGTNCPRSRRNFELVLESPRRNFSIRGLRYFRGLKHCGAGTDGNGDADMRFLKE